MAMFKSFVLGTLIMSAIATPAFAQRGARGEQDDAYRATRDGAVRSLRSVENAIVPAMEAKGAAYIGAEFDGQGSRYRLKFMKGRSVIWIDVDGRSGTVIGKTGE